ncbi:MAG: rod-binding protein [Planctomycetales bacterium]|nr:rod-binding protein [Planctomycetales bacterium]
MTVSTLPTASLAGLNQLGSASLASLASVPQSAKVDQQTAAERQLQIESRNEALKEFESIFVSLLIKEMRQSSEGLFPGDSTDSLGALFDQHVGKSVAEGPGLGIAEQIARYMEARDT